MAETSKKRGIEELDNNKSGDDESDNNNNNNKKQKIEDPNPPDVPNKTLSDMLIVYHDTLATLINTKTTVTLECDLYKYIFERFFNNNKCICKLG